MIILIGKALLSLMGKLGKDGLMVPGKKMRYGVLGWLLLTCYSNVF